MSNQVVRGYLSHILPAALIPICLYFVDDGITVVNLFKIGLLFPVLILAMRGLAVYFPAENLPTRSVGRVAEYAVLQGLVFAAFMVLFRGLLEPDLQSDMLSAVKQFAITALVMSSFNFFTAIKAQKKLRAKET